MKLVLILLFCFVYFTTLCFAYTPMPQERQCAIDYGFPDVEYDDISYEMFCPREPSQKFKEFVFCCLVATKRINEAGDIIDEEYKELFKDIIKGNNTLDYVYMIGKSSHGKRGRRIPNDCKGELNDVWSSCKKLYGYPKIDYESTFTKINIDEESEAKFKEFLLCGLKNENILNSEGSLDKESLSKTLFGKKILKKFAEKPEPEDKAEFAYQIARTYRH